MARTDIYQIPLFPLNSVLFPGMPLQLHIFEERYKKMIRLCLDTQQPFGVVLIRRGLEALGPLAEPHTVGCAAKIVHMQPLEDGRMNILAIGSERFRTLTLDAKSAPFLLGIVEAYPLVDEDADAMKVASKRLKPWLDRYLSLLAKIGDLQIDLEQIPDDPNSLAYLAAIALQISNEEKQTFLSSERTSQLLQSLYQFYRREVALMKTLQSTHKDGEMGSFSKN